VHRDVEQVSEDMQHGSGVLVKFDGEVEESF